MKQTKIFFQIVCATKYPKVLQLSIFNWYVVVNRGWLDCNSGPSISFLDTTKSNERKRFDREFSVSHDGNPEKREKYVAHFDTSNNYIGKGGGFPKHSADNDILHSSLLKPRKDTFNILTSIPPRNS